MNGLSIENVLTNDITKLRMVINKNNLIDFIGFLNILPMDLNNAVNGFLVWNRISGIHSISKNDKIPVVNINNKFQLFNFINWSIVSVSKNALTSIDDDKTDFNCIGSMPTFPINIIPNLNVINPVMIKISIEKIICPTKERKYFPIPVGIV